MKKLFSILLMMALLTGGASSARAQAAASIDQDIVAGEDIWLSSSVFLGDKLYLTGQGKVFSYTPGEDAIREMKIADLRTGQEDGEAIQDSIGEMLHYNLRLFTQGDRLYGVDVQEKGMIYPLAVEGETLSISDGVKIDTTPLRNMDYGDEGYVEDPLQLMGFKGRLYLINRTWGASDGSTILSLLSYDLEKGGEAVKHNTEFVWQLVPYKEDKLLALVMDPDSSWDEKTQTSRNFTLSVYDPQADSLEELGDSGVMFAYEGIGLAYDAANDKIYLQGRSEVYVRGEDGKTQIAAYLIPSEYGGSSGDRVFVLPQGGVIVITGKNIAVREADPARLPSSRLTIYGSYMDEVHQKAMQALGNVPVTFLDGKWFESSQALGQALVTGEDGIDILVIGSSYMDIDNLMSKGYAADLSANQTLKDYMGSLYPMMQETGQYDGKLYMVPVDMYANGMMSYYTEMFGQVDDVEVPGTYGELIDLIQRWNDELGELYPDMIPLQSDDYKNQMVQLAIGMQTGAMAAQGKEFSYNDPALKEMLAAALALRTDDISPKIDWESPDAQEQIDAIYNKVPLIEPYYSLDLASMNYDMTSGEGGRSRWNADGTEIKVGRQMPLQLAVREGEEPVPVEIDLMLMFVNPKSKNLDAAIAYVEAYVKNLRADKIAMMNPNVSGDILNPNFERELKDLDESINYYEEALKKAEGAEKTELERNYEEQKKYIENRREEAKYIAREQTVADYREIMKNSYIKTYSQNMAFNNEDMYTLLNRLIQGQTPLEQFVMEADGKLRLMRLEGQ